MSDDLLTTIKVVVDASGVATGTASAKRSIANLGTDIAKISKEATDSMAAIGKDGNLESGVKKATKAVIRDTAALASELEKYGTAAFNGFTGISKSAEQAHVAMAGKGIATTHVDAYIAKLKEAQGVQLYIAQQAATAAQATKAAAEMEAAAVARAIADNTHFNGLKTQWAAQNKALAEQEIANTKNKAAALAAYYTEAQNAELNLIHTGRGKSSAMLIDKGQRLGYTQAEIDSAVAGLKKVEAANAAAFAAANPHLAQLERNAAAAGTTVKGLSASLRNVPAQLTDIVVSLQGGQAPLTVLLQQGGQLKDMFGGIGNAGRALGGYIMGLINPLTLAAAAAGTLALAYLKGAAEGEAFNKALILSGNSAGATAAQLAGMAQNVAKATGGTIGAAADALAQLAGNGNIASAQFEKIAATAVMMEKTTGVAVADTVKQFAELGKDPLQASLRLNESTHHLTLSVYEQIKALTDQGRTLEAGVVAQTAWADVMKKRAPELIDNLGYIESAWRIVSGVAKDAWDAMAGIGRPGASMAQQIATQIAELEQLTAPGRGIFAGRSAAQDKELAYLRNLAEGYAIIEAKKVKEAELAGAQTKQAEKQAAFDKMAESSLQKQAKLRRDIALAGGLFDGVEKTPENIKAYVQRIKDLQEQYKPDKGPAAKAIKPDAWLTDVAKSYTKAMDDLDKVQLKASASADTLSKTQEVLRGIQSSSEWAAYSFRKKEEIIMAASLSQAEEDRVSGLNAATKAHDEYVNSLKNSANAIEKKQLALHDEVNAYAISIAQNISLAEAIDLVAIARLQEDVVRAKIANNDDAVAQIEREIDLRKKLAGDIRKHDAHKAEVDAAKEARAEWKRTADSINNTLTDALMRSFESGASFAKAMRDTVVNMFKTMVLRPIVSAIMTPVSMAINGVMGFSGAAAAGQGGNAMTNLSAAQTLKGVYDTATGGFNAAYVNAANTSYGSAAGLSTAPSGVFSGATAGELAYTNAIAGGATEAAANTAALQANTASLTSTGSALGTTLGLTASALAGISLGSAIAGDKSFMGMSGTESSTVGVILGAVGSYFGGPWGYAAGMLVGGVIGGVVNAAFGHGDTQVREQGTRGTFSSAGFNGSNYANLHQEGGWFSSDRNWTQTSAIDPTTIKAWSDAFAGVKSSVAGVALSLGLSTDLIKSYSKSIDLAAGSSKEAIQALFTNMADEMALKVAPSLTTLMKEGEAASATLSRLSTGLSTTNQWMSLLGHSLLGASLAGGEAASKLADAFGGLDKLTASSKAFYDTYYTESERAARSQQDMAKALALVGLALPATKTDLRSLAQTLDLTSDAGRSAYAVLMTIAPEFAATADALDKLATDATASLLKTFTLAGSIDFAGVGRALTTANTQSFVATINQAFVDLTGRIKTLVDGITGERKAVADAQSQINGPKAISYAGLQGEIAAIKAKSGLPSDAGVLSANAALVAANAAASGATNWQAQTVAEKARLSGVVDATLQYKAALPGKYQALQQAFSWDAHWYDMTPRNSAGGDAYQYDAGRNRVSDFAYYDRGPNHRTSEFKGKASTIDFIAQLVGANAQLAASEQAYASAATAYNGYADVRLAADKQAFAALTTKTAAEVAAKAAVLAYTAATDAFIVQASKSVPALTKLREETMAYYQAQKALSEGMTASAGNLRSAAAAMQLSQLDSVQSLAHKRADFAKNYSLALSTSGADKAGYADKMAAALPALSEALKETSTLRDWSIATAQLAAQSNTIAGQLDVAAAMDYQGQSLGLLASIDSTLALLDDSTAAITRAIGAGSDQTAAGLRGIITQLGGVPAFAGGGYHAGGLRIVGENGPELEVTGPSRIYNAAQLRSMGAGGTQGASTGQLEALVAALLEEVASLRAETRAITVHSANTADNTRRMERNGVLIYTDPAAPLKTEPVL